MAMAIIRLAAVIRCPAPHSEPVGVGGLEPRCAPLLETGPAPRPQSLRGGG